MIFGRYHIYNEDSISVIGKISVDIILKYKHTDIFITIYSGYWPDSCEKKISNHNPTFPTDHSKYNSDSPIEIH